MGVGITSQKIILKHPKAQRIPVTWARQGLSVVNATLGSEQS